jgi:hypothetical protein
LVGPAQREQDVAVGNLHAVLGGRLGDPLLDQPRDVHQTGDHGHRLDVVEIGADLGPLGGEGVEAIDRARVAEDKVS